MKWGSLSEFLAMGGYAFYVWGSYLVTVVCLAAEVLLLRSHRRTVLEQLSLTSTESDTEDRNETPA